MRNCGVETFAGVSDVRNAVTFVRECARAEKWCDEIKFGAAGDRLAATQAARVVPRELARFSVAARTRCVSHMGRGDYAAADAHRGGAAVLRAFSRAIPECDGAGARAGNGSPEILGWLGLLQPRAEFASRRETNCARAWREISCRARKSAGAARHREVHGGGNTQHCV